MSTAHETASAAPFNRVQVSGEGGNPVHGGRQLKALAVFAAITFGVALFGGMFSPTGEAGEWYESINKPAFTPPNWVFPVAWTILYAMIAVAGWMAYKFEGAISPLVAAWGAQSIFNAGWSVIFFGLQNPRVAMFELVFLWISIAAFIVLAWKPVRRAAYLFIPYLAWVTFAGMLNLAIWQMNG